MFEVIPHAKIRQIRAFINLRVEGLVLMNWAVPS
jgi:hypothetical protein